MKLILPERKELIKSKYHFFELEYYGMVTSNIKDKDNAIHIEIVADDLLSCDDGGSSFNALIGLSNMSQFKIVDGKIVVILWFRCWEWVKR
jgi:hypothetical protein